MTDYELDEVDQEILRYLQADARNNTNTLIGEEVDVSPSTVGKRIRKLEESGIIRGYYPDIDYDKADFPLRVLFICTSNITKRSDRIQQVRELGGVVSVRELMTGQSNVHVEVVGATNEDITRLAEAIDEIDFQIDEEILVKNEYHQPASIFDE